MHTPTDQALVGFVQGLHHHLTLSFVSLQTSSMPGQCKITTHASDAQPDGLACRTAAG